MTSEGPREDQREFAEESESLVRITLAPALWALHFVASYATTAVYCAKWGRSVDLTWLRVGGAISTVVVLALIAWLGWRAWKQWDMSQGRTAREFVEDLVEEEEGRHEFLGHAALLLAIISFIGVVYTALPVALIGSCR